MRAISYLWAFPVTAFGLLLSVSAACTGGRMRLLHGVVEAHGGLVRLLLTGNRFWAGGAAMTLGHVILARDEGCLERSRPHELGHVRQYERWGPLLLPAYWLIAARLKWSGRHPYLDHPFERMT